ncbi:hypothetical protein RRF57_012739 [Xylaria bambusicola]|uniref:Uncharacterized protein n=1 Tax=Xylaria bambusicola TaxID=326684 RepID=A0AAN7ZB14_9PEZI
MTDNPLVDADTRRMFHGSSLRARAVTSAVEKLVVQTAKVSNQALNPLAPVSARYALGAVDVLSKIVAAHLLALCQAFDLRAIEIDGRTNKSPDATRHMGQAHGVTSAPVFGARNTWLRQRP